MPALRPLLLLIPVAATLPLAALELDFAPAAGLRPGDIVGQAAGPLVLQGNPDWLFLEPGIGPDASPALRSRPGETRRYDRLSLPLPPGDARAGRVRLGMDLYLEPAPPAAPDAPSASWPLLALSLGRDAAKPDTGRALRLAFHGTSLKILNDDTTVRDLIPHREWFHLEAVLDFAARSARLQMDTPARPDPVVIEHIPFIVENGEGQDERGALEINSGGGPDHRFRIDNLFIREEPPAPARR